MANARARVLSPDKGRAGERERERERECVVCGSRRRITRESIRSEREARGDALLSPALSASRSQPASYLAS